MIRVTYGKRSKEHYIDENHYRREREKAKRKYMQISLFD